MSTVVRVSQRIDPAVEAARKQARAEQRRRLEAARQARRAAIEANRQQAVHRRENRGALRQNAEAASEARRAAREAALEVRRAEPSRAAAAQDRRELQEIAMAWTSWDDVLVVAKGLGYAVAQGGAIIDPSTEVQVPVDVTLIHQDGTEIGLSRAEDGTTWIVSADPHLESRVVRPLARAVGTLRAVAALRGQGMTVEFRELPDGEIQIEAARVEGGRAEGVRGHIDDSGSALLEVLGVKGRGCEGIVAEVARAMQGQIVQRAHTTEFYQQPGVADSGLAVRRE